MIRDRMAPENSAEQKAPSLSSGQINFIGPLPLTDAQWAQTFDTRHAESNPLDTIRESREH